MIKEGEKAFISARCPPFVGPGRGEVHPLLQGGKAGETLHSVQKLQMITYPMIPWPTHRKRLLRTAGAEDGVWHIRRPLELCTGLNDGWQDYFTYSKNKKVRQICHISTPKERFKILLTATWIAEKGRACTQWWRTLSNPKQTNVIPVQSICWQQKSMDHKSTNSGSTRKIT